MSYQTAVLACPEFPLPCLNPITGNLGTISRFQIRTRLPQKDAVGTLHRNYPTFSMSHTFFKMLKYASDSVDKPGASPLLALIGEAGAGKTSSAEQAMALVDGIAPETFNCGGHSLDDVLWEPVLLDQSRSLVEELENRFNTGSLHQGNRTFLQEAIPSAIVREELPSPPGQPKRWKESFSWDRVPPNEIKESVEALQRVIELENIGSSNGIGITYQEGPLIRAWKNAEEAEVKEAVLELDNILAKAKGFEVGVGPDGRQGSSVTIEMEDGTSMNLEYNPNPERQGLGARGAEEIGELSLNSKGHRRVLSQNCRFTATKQGQGPFGTAKTGELTHPWESLRSKTLSSGRMIIDEIDKRSPGTGKSLQQVWLVLHGLLENHKVRKNNMNFTFNRKWMPRGFSVAITGNDDRDLAVSEGLSKAQGTRMTILSIDKPGLEDIAQRICQALCGMSLLVTEVMPEALKNKENTLLELRTLGMNQPVLEEEAWLLRNYQKTLKAARQIASFILKWEALVDPENPQVSSEDATLEATSRHRETPGVRMAMSLIYRAKRNDLIDVEHTERQMGENGLEALLKTPRLSHEGMKSLGERIERIFLEAIQLSAGNAATKAEILMSAKSEGLTFDPDEEDNANAHRSLVRHLLNTEEESFVIQPETKAIQKFLYEDFIKKNKAFAKTVAPPVDDILPLRDVQAAITQFRQMREINTTESTTYMLYVNQAYVEGNKTEKAVECIPVLYTDDPEHEKRLLESCEGDLKNKLSEHLIDVNLLLSLLQAPKLGEETVESFWNKAWAVEIEEAAKAQSMEESTCIGILQGTCKDLRIAKVLVQSEGKNLPLMVLDSPKCGKTWLIGPDCEAKTLTRDNGGKKHIIRLANQSEIPKIIEEMKAAMPHVKDWDSTIGDELRIALAAYIDNKKSGELSEELEHAVKSRQIPRLRIPFVEKKGKAEADPLAVPL
jgi:hypothetical protein